MFACRQGHHQVVEALMESPDTDPNIISPTGSSALHLAAINSDECVKILGSDYKRDLMQGKKLGLLIKLSQKIRIFIRNVPDSRMQWVRWKM